MRKIYVLAIFILLLLLPSCSVNVDEQIEDSHFESTTIDDVTKKTASKVIEGYYHEYFTEDIQDDSTNSVSENTTVERSAVVETSKATTNNMQVFKYLEGSYTSSSGVGAWSTDFVLNSDGSFTGNWHDWDYESGNGYDSVCYKSEYIGKFSEPQKINDKFYSMRLEYVAYENDDGASYIEDNSKIISSRLGAPEISGIYLIYFPETKVSDMPEKCASWFYFWNMETTPKDSYVIYDSYNDVVYVKNFE